MLKDNMGGEILVDKLKILTNPSKKSAKQLLNDLNKTNYEVSIKNKGKVIVRIDKKQVPRSLNDKTLFVCNLAQDKH